MGLEKRTLPRGEKHRLTSGQMSNCSLTHRSENSLPEGWDLDRVNRLLEHYQPLLQDYTDAQQINQHNQMRVNIMKVPVELVPAVREMIKKHKAA